MNAQKTILLSSKAFIILSALCLLSVSLMAFINPQSVMDLVGVKLSNTDAFSSIRGVYGGVGLTLFICLFYCLRKNVSLGLTMLTLLWGFYALSRAITIVVEGPLGSFGMQWILTELVLFILALLLLLLTSKEKDHA